jgi:predicted CXXCH cytochrome family protein
MFNMYVKKRVRNDYTRYKVLICQRTLVLFVFFSALLISDTCASILTSKHNLSVSGPGQLKALSETRVCVFCHTPHNASPQTPLWNKDPGPVNYNLYESSTLRVVPSQPSGASRLCLTCHDGLIALGALLTGPVQTTGEITVGSRSYIGIDLADDHPVSISYINAIAGNPEIVRPVPSDPRILFYGSFNVTIECSTCHDPHNDDLCDRGFDCKFLVMDNKNSELCLKCHALNGWFNSSEYLSVATWNENPPDPWPVTEWDTVGENACMNCHVTHAADGPERLLNYFEEELNCYPCHNGNVASLDVQADFEKISHHMVENTTGIHDPEEDALISGHVECVDCHNPHAYNQNDADAPNVSGMIDLVNGVDRFGAPKYAPVWDPANYEYEICFKCHGDTSPGISYIPRVQDETNTRLEFSLSNPSYHPVEGIGKNPDMPSLPSTLEPTLTASSIIYCMDCHDSDTSSEVGGAGPKGTHGSIYAPILRERYETDDFTAEIYQNYALCYRCHDRTSILNDESFGPNFLGNGGHSGHLANGAPCSACHDPHGVQDVPGGPGDHTHLINFDTRIVSPLVGGGLEPHFNDTGTHSGFCTLVCHGISHSGSTYAY